MNQLRQDALSIWRAAVDAVRPQSLLQHAVVVDDSQLRIGGSTWDLTLFDRIVIVGAGKAATAMAEGFVQALDGCLPVTGWINVPQGTEKEIDDITVHVARPPGVNEPTEAGVRGTEAILRLVGDATERDLCIALISGGGSALLPAPVDGITLDDKLAVTRFLSSAGANIGQLNTVRKHLSRVKGGGLLAACNAGDMITLVLSDVLGDPLDLIASGPTVPDPSTPQQAIDVLRHYDPERTLSQRIYDALEKPTAKKIASAATTLVIGSNQTAVTAAANRAIELGYDCSTESAARSEGLAEDVGRALTDRLLGRLNRPDHGIAGCFVSGGEPTVRLCDEQLRGKGGRNQQLALAAYQRLVESELSESQWKRVVVLSGGTDGEDGPTDAAGAVVDCDVHHRIVGQKIDPESFLRRNDAYSLFDAVNGLIVTGPTGTNVCDVRVLLIAPDSRN
ncbi:MAG: DUF4147 domain-containing protein [Pirellulaceae bacterium]|nr:DUF4147 domain-containing protein [Pirellulaceae bacterium]